MPTDGRSVAVRAGYSCLRVSALSNRCVQLAVRQSLRYDVARVVSTIAAPAPVAATLLVGVACSVSTSPAQGLILGVLLAVCATLPATLYIEHVLQPGGVRQHYLWRRSERLAPLAIACTSVLVTIVLVRALDAPRHLETVLVMMLVVVGLTLAVTPLHRISVHMAAITGALLLLQLVFGAIGVAALPIAAIVGWSRLELSEHTPTQVIAGAIVGAIGASVAYMLFG